MAVTDGRRDSGIDRGKVDELLHSKRLRTIVGVFALVLIIAFFVLIAMKYREQERMLNELEAELKQLTEQYESISRERELLESKLEYTKSLEGLLQYARDNLGYIDPGDSRYEDGNSGGTNGN